MLIEYNKLFSEYYKNRTDNKKESDFIELIRDKFENLNTTQNKYNIDVVERRGYKINKDSYNNIG